MMKNKIIILVINLLICFTSLSCQKSNILEYGKTIDLEKIDWEKQNLDSIFAKIGYIKEIEYKLSDSVNNTNKSIIIQSKFNVGLDSLIIQNKITSTDFITIMPNQKYLEPFRINRQHQLLKKAKSFGYEIDHSKGSCIFYKNKEINFNTILTTSTSKEKLGSIIFSKMIKNKSEYAIDIFNKLKDFMLIQNKNMILEDKLKNNYFVWKSDNKKIILNNTKLTSANLIEKNIITLQIIYYNQDTKEILKGIY